MAKKKKVVHWSKLPRTKLISMVKKLELANARLKTQLAEARELRLLNDRQGAEDIARMRDEAALAETFGVVHVKQEDSNCVLQEPCMHTSAAKPRMPWETE